MFLSLNSSLDNLYIESERSKDSSLKFVTLKPRELERVQFQVKVKERFARAETSFLIYIQWQNKQNKKNLYSLTIEWEVNLSVPEDHREFRMGNCFAICFEKKESLSDTCLGEKSEKSLSTADKRSEKSEKVRNSTLRVPSKVWRRKKNRRVAPLIISPRRSNDDSIGDTNSSKLTLQGSFTHFLDPVSGSSESIIKSVRDIFEKSRLNIKRKKELSSRRIIHPANIRSIRNSSRSREGKTSVRSASYEDSSRSSSVSNNSVQSTSLSIKIEQPAEGKTQGRLIIVQPCSSLTPSSYDSLGSENLPNWIYPGKGCSLSDSNSFGSWSVSLGQLDDYSEEESAPVHPCDP